MFLYEDKEFIGKKIKQLRTNAKMSQSELSEKIGMSEKNLSNIERGLQIPALNNFLRLLDILNVSLSEFGISSKDTDNKKRDMLIKKIYLLTSEEIDAYTEILDALKKLRQV